MIKIGEHLIHFDQLPSTNAYAAELLSKDKPKEGTVISTDYQYAGKGQLTNKWESAPNKNVSLSVILYPAFLYVEKQFYFNQAISIAVYHTIEAYLPGRVMVKWPNDIYIDDKKVTGILIQSQIQGRNLSSSIVGIGINVNQEKFLSDAKNPVSIYNVIGKSIELGDFKAALLENLTRQYQALRLGAYTQISDLYHQVLYRKDQLGRFMINGNQEISGSILGVNEIGLLRVLIDGQIHEFGFKEIRYL